MCMVVESEPSPLTRNICFLFVSGVAGSMYGGDRGYCSPPFRPLYPHDNTNTFTGGLSDGLSSYSPGPMPYSHPHDDFSDMRGSTRGADGNWSGMGQRSFPPGTPATGPPSSSTTSGFTTNSSSSGQSMPPSTASVPPYGIFNRINRMSPVKQEVSKPFTPQKASDKIKFSIYEFLALHNYRMMIY